MKKRKSGGGVITSEGDQAKKAREMGHEEAAAAAKVVVVATEASPSASPLATADCTTTTIACWEAAEGEMWWGGRWFPSWDVEGMGEAYISMLYSDVWDGYDDIWDFRDSDKLPTST